MTDCSNTVPKHLTSGTHRALRLGHSAERQLALGQGQRLAMQRVEQSGQQKVFSLEEQWVEQSGKRQVLPLEEQRVEQSEKQQVLALEERR
jgi:hypothetical protein